MLQRDTCRQASGGGGHQMPAFYFGSHVGTGEAFVSGNHCPEDNEDSTESNAAGLFTRGPEGLSIPHLLLQLGLAAPATLATLALTSPDAALHASLIGHLAPSPQREWGWRLQAAFGPHPFPLHKLQVCLDVYVRASKEIPDCQ